MSYLLPHLHSGYAVDQAILYEEDRLCVIRFGHDSDPECMLMDETLSKVVNTVRNFAVIYLVDITEVPDFNTMVRGVPVRKAGPDRPRSRGVLWGITMGNTALLHRPLLRLLQYELYDPCTVMFFYRNKHMMIDLGTGNNNKLNWALTDTQEFIDILETIYR